MSIKKAQGIANRIQDRMTFNLVAYQRDELEWLKAQLEEFLDTEIEPEELTDPDEFDEIPDTFSGLEDEELLGAHDE